jgi:dipeptidyl aminopeptidase/acylaminoacyl peptidase
LININRITAIVWLLAGLNTTAEVFANQDKAPLLSQDLNSLKTSDGKIVEAKHVKIRSPWSERTECYRIKYLSDDLKVVGFIVKPRVEGAKYPVIIYNRGGNREFGKITEGTLKYLTFLSSNNYVVLASQYRGNDGGEGEEEFGGKDVNDVLNLIRVAETLSFTEPAKIAMLGYSRGGMMTYLAIKHRAQIKAAAIVGGITDLIQSYHEREEDMKRVIRELVGTDEAEWQRRSAVYWPEKINVPILILHGEDDQRVNVTQVKKLSEKLTEAGKAHELVIYPGGDHGLNTHRTERNQKIFDWFQKYLNQ